MSDRILVTFSLLFVLGCSNDGSTGNSTDTGSGEDTGTDTDTADDSDTSTDTDTDSDTGTSTDTGDDTDTSPLENPTMELFDDPNPLTDLGEQAVDAAPTWLKQDLALALRQQDADLADELASLIVDATDPRLIDEIAFTIAHISPEHLADKDFYPELISLNAELIYEHEPLLDYVTLVEEGQAGVDEDFHTTATYTITQEGNTTEFTVDRNTYYWYVVHPTAEDEKPWFVDAWEACDTYQCAATPDDGWFWREFLFDAAVDTSPKPETNPVAQEFLPGLGSMWDGVGSDESVGVIPDIIRFMRLHPVVEWLAWGAYGERSIQPVRIYGLGRGNCGEWADMTTALGRTALIPTINVDPDRSWDHTWNSFWNGDRWVEWEPVNFWLDHEYGINASNYAVRGDGFLLLQTNEYTDETFTMRVEVTDTNGDPIAGASAIIWYITESGAYKIAGEAPTNFDGTADFPLVPEQNYGVRIETPLGSHPEGDNSVALGSDGIGAGEIDVQSYTLDAVLPSLQATEVDPTGENNAVLHIRMTDQIGRFLTKGYHFKKTYMVESDAPPLKLAVVDANNYALFTEAKPFEAIWIGDETWVDLKLPVWGDLYLIISNTHGIASAALGNLSLELEKIDTEDPEWTEDTPSISMPYEILPGSHLAFIIDR